MLVARTGARGAPQQPVLAMPSPTVVWASLTALFGAVLSGAVWVRTGLAVERGRFVQKRCLAQSAPLQRCLYHFRDKAFRFSVGGLKFKRTCHSHSCLHFSRSQAKRQQRVAAVENSVELSAPLAPALAVATASAVREQCQKRRLRLLRSGE